MTIEVDGAVAEHHILRHQTQRRVAVRHEEEEDEEIDIGSFRDVAVDFVAGCVSGCAGIVVGQPFDTVKVRVQTQDMPAAVSTALSAARKQPQAYKGAMECAAETVSREGVLALFKGMGTPLASAALVNAITFGAYEHSQRVLTAHGLIDDSRLDTRTIGVGTAAAAVAIPAAEQDLEGRRNAGFLWSFVGGSFAGLCQAVVVVPTDNIKIKLQVQVGAPGSRALLYEGPVDCALKIVKSEGLGSLFRGSSATAIRDTPSMGLYFASYEGVKGWMERRWGLGKQASSFWAGGIAGAVSWVAIYPFDVVKSIQQASPDPLDPSTRSMTACFRKVYNSAGGGVHGVRRLFRGVGTTVVRAAPVNAAIFPTFEWTVRVLNQAFPPK